MKISRMAEKTTRIAVLGAGTIGVSTAYNLQRLQHGGHHVEVTLIADQFSPDTTSSVSGGFWRPHLISDTPTHKVLEWGRHTWDHLLPLAQSSLAAVTGIFLTSGRELFRAPLQEEPFWKDIVIGYRKLSDRELRLYPGYVSGYFYTSIIADQSRYLPWLMSQFEENGGKVKQMRVTDFSVLYEYDVIVNCTGMGARALCGDDTMQPSRGHVIRARAPWMKHFTVAPDDKLHIMIQYDAILLGMTEREDDDPEFKQSDREHIISGCTRLEPSVAHATEHRDYLGFRPTRPKIRLEVEYRHIGTRMIPIVHNYGHGGCGITLHWGCALEATQLVNQELLAHARL